MSTGAFAGSAKKGMGSETGKEGASPGQANESVAAVAVGVPGCPGAYLELN